MDELSSRADAAAAEAERGYIVCGQLLLVTAVVTLAAAIAVDPAACAPLAVGTAWVHLRRLPAVHRTMCTELAAVDATRVLLGRAALGVAVHAAVVGNLADRPVVSVNRRGGVEVDRKLT